MPKIDNPTELANCIAQNDALTAQLAEFEAMKAEFEQAKTDLAAAQASLAEITTQRDAFEAENKDLKTAASAYEDVGKQIEAEVQKNVELTQAVADAQKALEDATADYAALKEAQDAEIASLKEQAEAFINLATEHAEEAESVQAQFELLGQHLQKKGAVPDIVEGGIEKDEASESYKTWISAALSKRPEDRRAARLMKKANKEITSVITKNTTPAPPVVAGAAPAVTPAQLAKHAEWMELRAKAKANDKNPKLHAEYVVAARRLYKEHQADIDACAAVQAA